MSNLKLFLFGPPRVELDSTPVEFQRRKALALLIYLALNGQPHGRDTLATLFYGDHSQRQARAYLRRDLAVLNTNLNGDWLDADRETAQLKNGFWADVLHFRRLIAQGQSHNHPVDVVCSKCIPSLAEAVTLYGADFLAGFTLRDSPEFDDWQFFQAESLRQELALALDRLALGLSEQGQYEAAIAHARRRVTLDPLHEPAQRQLMQLYAQAGQQAAALRQYEEAVRLLDEEFGVPPEAETATLYEAIKARRLSLSFIKAGEHRRTLAGPGGGAARDLTSLHVISPAPPRPDLPAPDEPAPPTTVTRPVGRETELEQLRGRLDKSLRGNRQLVFVSGEPGLGKTTLVETFLAEVAAKAAFWIGRGQCIEHRGVGEAYLPLLEALGRLGREPGGPALIALLARQAPTWLAQMPWLVSAEEFEALQSRVVGATRERMLREMVETLETLTAERPMVLLLEDLHWSDYSTLDLLDWLARRQEAARLLVIGTYRPAEAKMRDHPLHALIQELQIRGRCVELSLPFLAEAALETYLTTRFAGLDLPDGLVDLLYRRTGGNPLFMNNVVDSWVARGYLAEAEGAWRVQAALETLAVGVPENLRGLIEQQFRQLEPQDREILEAASVVGMEFSTAAVAAGLDYREDEVETRCAALARRGQFLGAQDVAEWPDGTIAARFGFIHHLYQEVLYDRLPVGRQIRLHRQIGERLETGYSWRAPEMATELALHFRRGRDARRAVHYLQFAAEQALLRSAHREAVEHLSRGLEILRGQPDFPDRAQYELTMQATLGPALIALRGWSAPEAEQAYTRACELGQQMENPRQLSSVLYGLATMHEIRGEYAQTQALLQERLQLPQDPQDDGPLIESHELLACSKFHTGAFTQALDHAEQGTNLYNPQQHLTLTVILGENPGVSCHHWAALALWFLGYPDQALQRIRQALNLAQDLTHSFCLAHAQEQAAYLHQLRQETRAVQERAEATITLAAQQGYPYRIGTGTILLGWVLAAQGEPETGIARLREGLAICHSTGAKIDHPYFLGLLADAYGRAGQPQPGLETLAEALALVRNSRTFFYEAELHRLKGALLLQTGSSKVDEAEASFQQALEVARRQKAKSMELRAAMSLGRVWQRQGQPVAAHQLLAGIYDRFTEGFDTLDLQQARALLEELV